MGNISGVTVLGAPVELIKALKWDEKGAPENIFIILGNGLLSVISSMI